MQKTITTLVLVYDDDRVLLGMKKRGFGNGKWNGFGGKVGVNETIKENAIRELYEEAVLKIKNSDAVKERGVMNFSFEGKPHDDVEVHVFSIPIEEIVGDPKETEKMRPEWFNYCDIPFKEMWLDDEYWVPILLSGKNFEGEFKFNVDGSSILEKRLETK